MTRSGGEGTEEKRMPSGHHGIAVSDPQVKSEASRQAAAQPATTKRLGQRGYAKPA